MATINLKSESFKQEIYNLINKSQLPVSNIYYIITLLQKQIEIQYYAALNAESIQQQQKQSETEEKEETSSEG